MVDLRETQQAREGLVESPSTCEALFGDHLAPPSGSRESQVVASRQAGPSLTLAPAGLVVP